MTSAYLVEIGLQEMHFLGLFQQPWPVLLLELLLSEYKLHIARGVMRLALLDVDFARELELDVVGGLLRVGVAGEGQGGWFQVDFEGFVGHVGGRDGEEDVVALWVRGRGALSPGDWGESQFHTFVKRGYDLCEDRLCGGCSPSGVVCVESGMIKETAA